MDYFAYTSGIRNWNSGFKVALAVGSLVLCVAAKSPWIYLYVFLVMSYLTIGKGKLPIHEYLELYLIPAAFLIIGGLAIAVEIAANPVNEMNLRILGLYFFVTPESITKAVLVMLRALGAVSALYMMALSTSAAELIQVMKYIHVPSLIIELMHLIYRYVFVLMDTAMCMSQAAASRLGYTTKKRGFCTFGWIVSNLFLISLKKANVYYDAMVSRGFDGTLNFWEEKKPLKRDLLVKGSIYLLTLFLLVVITNVIG